MGLGTAQIDVLSPLLKQYSHQRKDAFQCGMEASFSYQQPLKSSPCYGLVLHAVSSHDIHPEHLRGVFRFLKRQALFPEKFISP